MNISRVSSSPSVRAMIAFASGMLFAVGLALAGMTKPAKVMAFLDVAGAWDPSLAFVMIGATSVYAVAHRLVLRRRAPMRATAFQSPSQREIDAKLLVGAGLFGVGWGLAGYCPGPALTSLATASLDTVTFVLAMAMGMLLHELSSTAAERAPSRPNRTTRPS